MKPSPKYAACVLLYHLEDRAVWEYEIFEALERVYPPGQLNSLREDLVGLSTLGWISTAEQKEYRGRILRSYALNANVRPVLEYQLRLASFDDIMRQAGIPIRGTGVGTAEVAA
jgi:hypothetical protein